jgi:hypothetical protein
LKLVPAEEFDSLKKQIRPALAEYCYNATAPSRKSSRAVSCLIVATAGSKGGDSGPAIVPEKPDESLLIKAVRRLDKDLAMPPKKELPNASYTHSSNVCEAWGARSRTAAPAFRRVASRHHRHRD